MQSLQLPARLRAAALLLAVTTATAHGSAIHQPRVETRWYPTRGIRWHPCPEDVNAVAALNVECGTLDVPRDYTAANSTDTLELSLVRVPALKKPASHSILFNFGGPGQEARHTLAQLADMLQV